MKNSLMEKIREKDRKIKQFKHSIYLHFIVTYELKAYFLLDKKILDLNEKSNGYSCDDKFFEFYCLLNTKLYKLRKDRIIMIEVDQYEYNESSLKEIEDLIKDKEKD